MEETDACNIYVRCSELSDLSFTKTASSVQGDNVGYIMQLNNFTEKRYVFSLTGLNLLAF